MQVDLDSDLDQIMTAVQNWDQNGFLGFAPCLHKLSCTQNHPVDKMSALLQLLCTQVKLLPPAMASELLQSVSDPTIWIYCDSPLCSALTNFLIDLTVHFNELLPDVCDICVQLILMKPISQNLKQCGDQAPMCSAASMSVTASLLSTVPQSESMLTDRIISKFPGWRKPIVELLLASSNILYLAASPSIFQWLSIPNICSLLGTVCKLIIDLELSPDASSHRVAHEHTSLLGCETTVHLKTVQDRVYELNEQLSADDDNTETKVDLLTWIVMIHLRAICIRSSPNSTDGTHLDWSVLCATFKRMRQLFGQFVLPVNAQMKAFPLLCLYTASLRGGLMINWTEFLWNTVRDDHQDCGTRVKAVAYLASLLTRAQSCPSDLVIELLHDMTRWCVDYVYRHRGLIAAHESGVLVSENRVYYAVCHTVFYILVQLHAILLDNPYYRASCESLPLAQIMLSPLNPLDSIPIDSRWVFEQIAHTYHLTCASVGIDPISSTLGSACEGTVPVVLDAQLLSRVQPSQLFSLPFQSKVGFMKPVIQALFREFTIGKLFSTSTDASQKTGDEQKPKRKRRLHQGVDVKKLARIATNGYKR